MLRKLRIPEIDGIIEVFIYLSIHTKLSSFAIQTLIRFNFINHVSAVSSISIHDASLPVIKLSLS